MTERVGIRKNILNFIQDHKFLSLVIVLLLAGGIYEAVGALKSSNTPHRYAVSQAQKGTLIVTVSGSGQVLAENQIDIKPKISGVVKSIKVNEGDKVTAGTVVAQLDSTDAQKNVRDATLNLQSAQVALQKLTQPADELSVIQAQNDYAQAQRDLKSLQEPADPYDVTQAQNAVEQAQRNLEQAQTTGTQQTLSDTQNLQTTNSDAYNGISDAFVNSSGFIADLKAVQNPGENVSAYKLILGQDSPLVIGFVSDYDSALSTYNSALNNYKNLSRTADQATLYKFLNETLTMEKTIATSLEDARNMFDAIVARDYKTFTISQTVDNLKPKIEADITSLNKDLTALQNAKDTLDTLTQNIPINVQKSKDSVAAAEESLQEKQEFLEKLLAGAKPEDIAAAQDKVKQSAAALKKVQDGSDPLDVQNQQLVIQQRKNALADAKAALDDYNIKTPFDGVIAEVNVVKGDTASAGSGAVTIITNQLLAQISLNEVDAAKVKIGNKATLTFDAVSDVSITGELVQLDIIGTSTQGVVTYNAKVAFDTQDARIKPGMSVSAAVITTVDQDVLLVPNAAVKTQGSVSYVQVFDASQVTTSESDATAGTVVSLSQPQRKFIETGLSNDTQTEISGGLEEKEFVVTQTYSDSSTAAATSTGSTGLRIPGLGGTGGTATRSAGVSSGPPPM